MQGLIFLDTETTGIELSDRLFEVCYSYKGKIHSDYFKPPIPISIKAQSVTHVTNEMVEGKESFEGSKMKKDLQKLLKTNILVAHNALFDISMLDRESVETNKFICTYKVAKFLDDTEQVPEYNLQFLRYYFNLNVRVLAHDAKSDVITLEALFEKQFDTLMEIYKDQEAVIAKMMEVSLQPVIFKTFSFGKYRGRKIEEIKVLDKRYMEWLLGEKLKKEYGEEDWIFTLKSVLEIK